MLFCIVHPCLRLGIRMAHRSFRCAYFSRLCVSGYGGRSLREDIAPRVAVYGTPFPRTESHLRHFLTNPVFVVANGHAGSRRDHTALDEIGQDTVRRLHVRTAPVNFGAGLVAYFDHGIGVFVVKIVFTFGYSSPVLIGDVFLETLVFRRIYGPRSGSPHPRRRIFPAFRV